MKSKSLLTALALTSIPALAGPLPPARTQERQPATDSGWVFRAAPYLWAQGIDGTIGARGLEGNVDLSFSDIVSDLDFAFMGAFEARHGRWGIMTDFNYAEMSNSFVARDILLSGGEFKMKQFLGNLTLNYRVLENSGTVLDLYGGARLNWVDLDLNVTGAGGGRFGRTDDQFWADAVVGARFQTNLGDRWFFRASGDIGGGDSDLTWQAMALVGYRISDTCNVGLGYRELGTDYHSGGFTYDVTAQGPVLGVEWTW